MYLLEIFGFFIMFMIMFTSRVLYVGKFHEHFEDSANYHKIDLSLGQILVCIVEWKRMLVNCDDGWKFIKYMFPYKSYRIFIRKKAIYVVQEYFTNEGISIWGLGNEMGKKNKKKLLIFLWWEWWMAWRLQRSKWVVYKFRSRVQNKQYE